MPANEPASDGDDATETDGVAIETDGDVDATAAGIGDHLVATWTGLDRGWQALLLGVAIVAVHLLGQLL
ncbi:hypothetical protein GRS48_10875 [Halorubrum sp. JWXQ-INN 858]|uniref:hypothetical protein n=1 Tax=Halorubrum sp. JWXQ-INN 858 TaxID=2690782 RepID=UPI00135BA4DC|nr:hypothetical protein [Halorubrum sp. JWXQ-INN 858]MWV65318.1 hypothetical protein [Halorubrum sp. JWXQ-INN 858]